MNDTGTLHFTMALGAGLLTGFSGLGLLYVLEHAYGIATPKQSPLFMTGTAMTIAASLAILNWREDFDAMLRGEKPLLQHAVFRVWLAIFALWVIVVVIGSANAQHLRGEEWYQHMPGALIFYLVPTFLWLHLTRTIGKARQHAKETNVRAS